MENLEYSIIGNDKLIEHHMFSITSVLFPSNSITRWAKVEEGRIHTRAS